MTTWSGQVIVKSFINSVPDLYPTQLFFVFFVVFTSWVLDLRSDWSDGKTTQNRPLNGIALAFWEFYFFCGLRKSNLTTYCLLDLLVVNDLGTLFVKVGYGICLFTPVLLVNGDHESAVVAHAEIF